MTRLSEELGQATILAVLFMAVMIGLAAAVLDVGAWYRTDRRLQATADAAALAGAQALPDYPGDGVSLALEYAEKNGGGVDAAGIAITDDVVADDTIRVEASQPADGFFTQLFGFDEVTVRAEATARAGVPDEARWAAPIAVDEKHPKIQCSPSPCFGEATSLELEKVGPGAFRLLNLDDSHGGTGPPILADWIERGYEGWMPLKWYFSDPGAKFNSSHVKGALDRRIGEELLLPVYRGTRGGGANFEYEVVGWIGFHLTGYTIQGSKKNHLFGWFTRVVWEGIQSESTDADDFGVRSIHLIN